MIAPREYIFQTDTHLHTFAGSPQMTTQHTTITTDINAHPIDLYILKLIIQKKTQLEKSPTIKHHDQCNIRLQATSSKTLHMS